MVDKYNEIIKKHAKRTFILFEGVEWTYAKLDQGTLLSCFGASAICFIP